MLGAGGKSSAVTRGGGALAFSAICAASPRASSARTPRGTAAIGRCDIVSKVLAVQVEKRRRTDQHEVKRGLADEDRKSTRLNSSHLVISYAVFCLKKKKNKSSTFDN